MRSVVVVAAVFAVCGLRYHSLPWTTPKRRDVCGAVWERDPHDRQPDRGPRYEVTPQPPVIGTRSYSDYSAAERKRFSHGDMARPCGGHLFTVESGTRVNYVAPG
jgi:hypothetical protein